MRIGQAASGSGVSARMIRHYEAIGLLPGVDRRASGYRDYSRADIGRLQFIGRSRNLGFSIERIRVLLRLSSDQERSNADVKALASAHIAELAEKIRLLQAMSTTLTKLANACDGDGRRHCPILDGLESGAAA